MWLQAQILDCTFEKAGSKEVILELSLYLKTRWSLFSVLCFPQDTNVNTIQNTDI
jgi:hypothetical protein